MGPPTKPEANPTTSEFTTPINACVVCSRLEHVSKNTRKLICLQIARGCRLSCRFLQRWGCDSRS
jgi:hypothetical protein